MPRNPAVNQATYNPTGGGATYTPTGGATYTPQQPTSPAPIRQPGVRARSFGQGGNAQFVQPGYVLKEGVPGMSSGFRDISQTRYGPGSAGTVLKEGVPGMGNAFTDNQVYRTPSWSNTVMNPADISRTRYRVRMAQKLGGA